MHDTIEYQSVIVFFNVPFSVGMGVNMTMTLNPNGIGGLNPLMGAGGQGPANPTNMVPVQPGMGIMAMMASATQPSMAGVGMGPNSMGTPPRPAPTPSAAANGAEGQPSPPHNGSVGQNGACRKHSSGQPPGAGPQANTPLAPTDQILVPMSLVPPPGAGGVPDDLVQQPAMSKNEETSDTTVNIVDRTYF